MSPRASKYQLHISPELLTLKSIDRFGAGIGNCSQVFEISVARRCDFHLYEAGDRLAGAGVLGDAQTVHFLAFVSLQGLGKEL